MDPDEVDPVIVKPSTELIPDEYEHTDTKTGLVLIFHSEKDENNVKTLNKTLKEQGYNIPDENIHPCPTKQYVTDCLEKVAKQDHQDKSCLLLIIMGNADKVRDGEILPDKETRATIRLNEVWPLFSAMACPSLRYKPKVVLFQVAKRLDFTTFDSFLQSRKTSVQYANYDVPAEADMLLIFHAPDSPNREDFVEDLCQAIEDKGTRDDVVGLVTSTKQAEGARRPLLISTLTRKFFFTPSDKRGLYQDLHKNYLHMDKMAKELNEKKERPTSSRVCTKQTVSSTDGAKPKALNKREGVASKGNKPPWNASTDTKEKPRTSTGTKKKQATTDKKEEPEAAKPPKKA